MTDTSIVPSDRKPPIVVLREKLEARENELKNALTDIDPKHFIRALITSAQVNPDIQGCSWQSLWLATMKACRDNLLPDGVEGAIVPFKSNAQWIPMYRGLLKKFRASGNCKWITANVVREGEVFEHWITETGEHFKHVPGTSDGVAPVEQVYAAALTTDGAFYVAVMTMAEINKIKAMSRASREDSPWRQWPDEMMKKTALRRLSKLLPAGRDIFQQEEEEEDKERKAMPQPSLAVDNEAPRAPGAAAALETFAGAPQSTPLPPVNYNEPGAMDDAISIAYERGRIAKDTGAARKAIPTEYREENNRAEADAWYAGWDGKEDPSSGEIPD